MSEFSLHRHPGSLRIISLIPSATELVAALGLGEFLVGRSHECDYPAMVHGLPACTAPKFDPQGSSQVIHDRVTDLLQSALSVYRVDLALLQRLQPTHILTQAQCEVCAVSLGDVEQAVASLVGHQPQIISLQPNTLAELWAEIMEVATVLDAERTGELLLARLQDRVARCQALGETLTQRPRSPLAKPRVVCIEWIEPLMAAGNWVPELVALAGGDNCLGSMGQHSPWIAWEDLVAADPEVIVAMPCGFDIARTQGEMAVLAQKPEWTRLQAVQGGRVYVTDGNQYFNRPGPRLVDSLEMLQEIFFGEINPDCQWGFRDRGFRLLEG